MFKPEKMSERNKGKPDPHQLPNSKLISVAQKPTKPATGQCQRSSEQSAKQKALGLAAATGKPQTNAWQRTGPGLTHCYCEGGKNDTVACTLFIHLCPGALVSHSNGYKKKNSSKKSISVA